MPTFQRADGVTFIVNFDADLAARLRGPAARLEGWVELPELPELPEITHPITQPDADETLARLLAALPAGAERPASGEVDHSLPPPVTPTPAPSGSATVAAKRAKRAAEAAIAEAVHERNASARKWIERKY